MTIFAGVINLSSNPLNRELVDEFNAKFNKKYKHLRGECILNEDCILQYSDIEAIKGQFRDTQNKTVILAGDPIVASKESDSSINKLLDIKDECSLKTELLKARGSFCGVIHNKTEKRFNLFVDRLGVRPLFYSMQDNIFAFSTQINFLKSLSFISQKRDREGEVERVALGYCLSNRTDLKGIKRLDSAEILSVCDGQINIHSYWNWKSNTLAEPGGNVESVYNAFLDAINIRKNEENSFSFLSGGMDSRLVVSCLDTLGRKCVTYNFGTKNSQDSEFARLYAEKTKVKHSTIILPTLKHQTWANLIRQEIKKDFGLEKGVSVWSGDGGSVSLGGVYMDSNLVLNELTDTEIAERFVVNQKIGVLDSFLNKTSRDISIEVLISSLKNELESIPFKGAKKLYTFLMLNDQKRHLDYFYENIHNHKVELHLPFFDALFLEQMTNVEHESVMFHNFYMGVFNLLDDKYRTTPWQTYPGHADCPISYQAFKRQWGQKSTLFERWLDLKYIWNIPSDSYAYSVYNKKRCLSAAFLNLFGVRDYSYLVKTLKKVED